MLSNRTFYHGTTKKAIVAFGNLFNNINIERYSLEGKLEQKMKVPVSYSPKDKFIARLRQQPDIDNPHIKISLPRMGFEITGFKRDAQRQLGGMQQRKAIVNGQVNSTFSPVPYDLEITLYVATKTQDDGLQIMEQIIPNFNPTYTVTIKSIPELNLTEDLPITLESVEHIDDYEGDMEKPRQVLWIFNFTLQLNYYGPTKENRSIIKRTETTLFNDPEMNDDQRLTEIIHEVSPFTANADDEYTVITDIEGFE